MRVYRVIVMFVLAVLPLAACASGEDNVVVCRRTGQAYTDREVLEAALQYFYEYHVSTVQDQFIVEQMDLDTDQERCCWISRSKEEKGVENTLRRAFGLSERPILMMANMKFVAHPNINEDSKAFWQRFKEESNDEWTIEFGVRLNECLRYFGANMSAYPALD